ncbi:conjugative transposon protein TraJ [Nibrella saemangeumensis]|uniref:Conjugative transposon protein TraJ n=1 Tax=Nibrella saemangeumensis TaxID=1084526 RepID=A0ABP8N4Q5_9BACT
MILLQQPGAGTYVDYGFYQKFESMEAAIKTAFTEVLQGMGNLGDVASAIAAIAATFYIGFRILGHFARAETIDVYPLLRPFAIGFIVLNFTMVTDFLGALIRPVEVATQNMVDIQVTRIQQLEQMRQQKIQERMAQLDAEMGEELSNWSIGQYLTLVVEKQRLYIREGFDLFLKNIFYALFLAARLVIMTVRSFFLIVLTIIGPLAFAIAIFTGFQDSHLMWIARFVQISLWLPMANILGTIVSYLQGKVITLQYLEITNNVPDEAQSGPLIYIVFMIVATLSYFTIPTIASYIISSSGVAGALQRITSLSTAMVAGSMGTATSPMARNAVNGVMHGAGQVAGGVGSAAMMGAGLAYAAGSAAAKTAANYGSFYGQAAKQEFNNMRNITKTSD